MSSSFSNLVYVHENYQGTGKTILSIDYGLLTTILLEVVRASRTEIETLKSEVPLLTTRVQSSEDELTPSKAAIVILQAVLSNLKTELASVMKIESESCYH
jgi:hypothetical protein